MIAKHIPMRCARRSSFKELVAYITQTKDKMVRIGEVLVTNCHQDDARDAVNEVLATQLRNKRACNDKTYHLLISFPAGERPSIEALRGIEDEVSDALGFGEHQRVSAVHSDTDNLHLHVAINKIHPKRLTMHNPYCDYKALGAACARLERTHGLIPTNHETITRGARSRAVDMEHAAGMESLLGWIRRECLSELRGARSWAELHDALGRNGLVLREKGNGLIVQDSEGRAVKASSVARELSKTQLEKRLGPFEPATEKLIPAARTYQARPMVRDPATDILYQRYQAEQTRKRQVRMQMRRELQQHKHSQIDHAKQGARMKRGLIRELDCDRLLKRMLYHQASTALREDIKAIWRQDRAQREAHLSDAKPLAWFDWLVARAAMNDAQALEVLRRRQCRAARRANGLLGIAQQGREGASVPGLKIDGVTKQGTLIYREGKSAIRDSGPRLEVSEGLTQEGLEVALNMAVARFGKHISIEGDDAFRERVLRTAQALRLDIVFADRTQKHESVIAPDMARPDGSIKVQAGTSALERSAGEEAARRYIAEREAKRRVIPGMPKHVLGKPHGKDIHKDIQYAGWRRVDGELLLLARTGADEIVVMPADEAMLARASRLKLGDKINLDGVTVAQSRESSRGLRR